MPRTAPTVDGSGNFRRVTLKYMDADGEPRSDSYQVDSDASAAEIEALVVAMGAGSNANLYSVEVTEVYNAAKVIGPAIDAPRVSVHDNIVFLWKDIANHSRDFFLPSPVSSTTIAGTVNPDAASPLIIAIQAALAALNTNYSAISLRFTERREKNASVPAS